MKLYDLIENEEFFFKPETDIFIGKTYKLGG